MPLNCVWLNALNASPRSCRFGAFVEGKFLLHRMFQLLMPGLIR